MIGQIEYYSRPANNYRQSIQAGQIAVAPIPYLLEKQLYYLRLDYLDNENPKNSNFTIESAEAKTFKPSQSTRYLLSRNLTRDEFILCTFHKLRPVIIITEELPNWTNGGSDEHKGHFAVPLYSIKDDNGINKFPQEFLLKTQAYKYPTLFYLPKDDKYFEVDESIARFDRIAFLSNEVLRPCPVCLTVDAMYCIQKWLNFLFGADMDEVLKAYREEALRQLES